MESAIRNSPLSLGKMLTISEKQHGREGVPENPFQSSANDLKHSTKEDEDS